MWYYIRVRNTYEKGITMNRIIILAGVQGSGKTTKREELLSQPNESGWFVISTDDMLKAYFDVEFTTDRKIWSELGQIIHDAMVHAVAHGRDIIYDTTLSSPVAADRLLNWLDTHAPNYSRELVLMDTPVEECIRRISLRNRKVPEDVVRATAARMEDMKKWFAVCGRFKSSEICNCPFCKGGV